MEPEGSLSCPQEVFRLQTKIVWFRKTGAIFPRVKCSGREADHSPPSSKTVELYLHYLICLRALVLNYLNAGSTLYFYSVQWSAFVNTVMKFRVP
jgi:hypothetical protein